MEIKLNQYLWIFVMVMSAFGIFVQIIINFFIQFKQYLLINIFLMLAFTIIISDLITYKESGL